MNKNLSSIAQIRGCSDEEALHFCLKVQALRRHPTPSYKSIAQAVRQLEPDADIEVVAQEAARVHLDKLRQRGRGLGRGRGRWQSPGVPRYVIVEGVVESTVGWQKREGITKDR
jgi:hypothetical protein